MEHVRERDPNKTANNRSQSRERLNTHSSVRAKYLIAANEVEKMAGRVNIYPMPSVHQLVWRKMGLELLQQMIKGEVTRLVLQLLKILDWRLYLSYYRNIISMLKSLQFS